MSNINKILTKKWKLKFFLVFLDLLVFLQEALWPVCSSLDQAVWVQALTGDIVLCSWSWARRFTLTVPLSTQVYKWVPATLMLGVTLRWHLCPEMQAREIQCSSWISITKCHFGIHIWQNYVCFGDFIGKGTLCDAYHKRACISLICISRHTC